jgi:ketosteroid isomerase-like protein
MSENLDLVRSIYADWERGDISRAEWADPEIDLVVVDGPTPGRAHGIPGMALAMREFLTASEGWRTQAEEYREVDNERILVMTRESARGKTSGVDTRQMRANVFHLRGGRVTRLAIYWDRSRALADLGLASKAMPEDSTTSDLEEIRRKTLEAVNRGDIDAAMSVFRPDAVWDSSALGLGAEKGLAAIRARLEEWMESFEGYEIVGEEFRDLGNGVVFGVSFQKGRPLGSIGFVQLRIASISIWAEDRIGRWTTYTDIDQARGAAERLAQERE